MFKRFDIYDFVFGLLTIIIVTMIVFPLAMIPKSLETDKMCLENGYKESEWYFDGTIYCSRKGEMGKDEIVRIK